ncbi:CDP-glycerol:glycerophosphate glycerophosphotransferase [Staphylococcus xylosus]|uniref:CDP-glycerol:glycerophosphate glycerophosphotransferase n=1 Tax=Staphylococcus xylosus TaxID=1288 RepID=UPI003F553DBF
MNLLTVIKVITDKESLNYQWIDNLKKQITNEFDIIVVNETPNLAFNNLIKRELKSSSRVLTVIDMDKSIKKTNATNMALKHLSTPYFTFFNDNILYAQDSILLMNKHVIKADIVFGIGTKHIENFENTSDITPKIEKQKVEDINFSEDMLYSPVYKTSIAKKNHIKLRNNNSHYNSLLFLSEYLKIAEIGIVVKDKFIYLLNEDVNQYDNQIRLENRFVSDFNSFVSNIYIAKQICSYSRFTNMLSLAMRKRIKKDLDPSTFDVRMIYQNFDLDLIQAAKQIKIKHILKTKPFFLMELLFLRSGQIKLANKMNKFRHSIRLAKFIVAKFNSAHISFYQLIGKKRTVKSNMVVFESFGGKSYSDNPKYIYEYMYKKYPDLNYTWVMKEPNHESIPGNPKIVEKNSKEYFKTYAKTKYWVSNSRLPLYLEKKKDQLYIQTWHGTPLKRLANDMKDVKISNTPTAEYKYNFKLETQRWDYLISPNPYSSKIFKSAFWLSNHKLLKSGYPRNDLLVNNKNDLDYIKQIKQKLNIPKNKKVVMYAPTWRDDEYIEKGKYKFDIKLDLDKLKCSLSDEFIVLLRMHYLIAEKLNLEDYENFVIDVSHHGDISELFLITDCLITDYSSVMFDFGNLKKPQLFFTYDLEKYEKELRGFYLDYYSELPGPIYTTSEELIEGILNIDLIRNEYNKKIEQFYRRFCQYEKGKSSNYVGDFIYRDYKK